MLQDAARLLPPADAIARLKEMIRLNFSRKDNAFFCKKLAEVYAALGSRRQLCITFKRGYNWIGSFPG